MPNAPEIKHKLPSENCDDSAISETRAEEYYMNHIKDIGSRAPTPFVSVHRKNARNAHDKT